MQNNRKPKAPVNDGLGKTIPPDKKHVLVWFLYMNATESVAFEFWDYYTGLNWCCSSGSPIKDWKVKAWEWLWNSK